MKVLIGQPIHEEGIEQLRSEIHRNSDIDIVLFPEGYIGSLNMLEAACKLAKEYGKVIITGYRDINNKDRAVIINNLGVKILDREKTPEDKELYSPSVVYNNGIKIGYLLCREILKGLEGLMKVGERIYLITHPIGVGMFSEEQFRQWINEARKIARACGAFVVGTSHGDGSYRNCGVSIPIAYCIDKNGEELFISKSDLRTRIVDLSTGSIEIV